MVFDRLHGWVEAGIARGRYGPLFALTRALGRRAWQLPQLQLQDLLRTAIGPDTLPSVARTATGLLLDDPRRRSRRVAEVLDVDSTAVTIDQVWATLCTSRTDLLDQVLNRAPHGRFVAKSTRWVPGRAARHPPPSRLIEALGAALARFVDRDTGDDQPGDPTTDRPARRRIELLARGAVVRSKTLPVDADRAGLVGPARWLADHATFAGTALGLLVDLGRLDNLDDVAGLCTGRPVLAVHTAERIGARLRSLRQWPDPAILAGTVARLARRGDLAGGLFAVALVQHGAGFGWHAPWRDLLLRLRQHSDDDVREQAYTIDMVAAPGIG